jgi:hypothetical protein
MASNVTDTEHIKLIPLAPLGAWMEMDVRRSQDPEASDFQPPFFDPKPVLYMPSKRRQGVESFPQLVIHIQILQEDQRFTVQVPAWTGAAVNVTVRNVWDGVPMFNGLPRVPTTKFSGTLNKGLECSIRVPADTVKQWMDPKGDLGARVNENLLEFYYEIPSISKDGKPLQGFSVNRVYVYRRKTIVFLPGLFASEFKVKLGEDKQAAFPNFFVDQDGMGIGEAMWKNIGEFKEMVKGAAISGEHVGLLECDSQGVPLLEADKPMLLRLGPFKTILFLSDLQVEDFFVRCHDAAHDRPAFTANGFPDKFRLFELQLFCYDWRGDLTQTVGDLLNNPKAPKRSLKHLQESLRRLPDTDDQVAIMGHSTGGVLIRRLLAEDAASAIISHAFFVDVPFRGAPKALGVALTGCDPPGGGPMIPFIDPKSMVSIAVTEPIVYHLAPSSKFPGPVISTPDYPNGCGGDIEKEKASLLDSAADRGMYSPRYAVDPAKASNRINLGKFANQWADFWDSLADWYHARPAFKKGLNAPTFAQFESNQLDPLFSDPILKEQYESRTAMKWSSYLAGRAKAFHEASERLAASGAWASKAYLFYSTGSPTPTTQSIKIELIEQRQCWSAIDLISPNLSWQLAEGTARPSRKNTSHDGKHCVEYEQWVVDGDKMFKRFWRLSAVQDKNGDGTVPLCSQIGFGGDINVFKALPGAPDHVPAPNNEWMWSRVIDVLLGYDVTKYLDKRVDPKAGVIKS